MDWNKEINEARKQILSQFVGKYVNTDFGICLFEGFDGEYPDEAVLFVSQDEEPDHNFIAIDEVFPMMYKHKHLKCNPVYVMNIDEDDEYQFLWVHEYDRWYYDLLIKKGCKFLLINETQYVFIEEAAGNGDADEVAKLTRRTLELHNMEHILRG